MTHIQEKTPPARGESNKSNRGDNESIRAQGATSDNLVNKIQLTKTAMILAIISGIAGESGCTRMNNYRPTGYFQIREGFTPELASENEQLIFDLDFPKITDDSPLDPLSLQIVLAATDRKNITPKVQISEGVSFSQKPVDVNLSTIVRAQTSVPNINYTPNQEQDSSFGKLDLSNVWIVSSTFSIYPGDESKSSIGITPFGVVAASYPIAQKKEASVTPYTGVTLSFSSPKFFQIGIGVSTEVSDQWRKNLEDTFYIKVPF